MVKGNQVTAHRSPGEPQNIKSVHVNLLLIFKDTRSSKMIARRQKAGM